MKKSSVILVTAFWLVSVTYAYGQLSGRIVKKELGLEFTIPSGWTGQEAEGAIVLVSNTTPGFVLLSTHEASSLQELRTLASQGWQEEGGTTLQPSGNIENIGNNGIGAEFTGTLEWQKAKAYAVGLVNPYGDGVTILAVTDPENYSSKYRDLARQIAQSFKFLKPVAPPMSPVAQQWKQKLSNTRLNYMSSYSSGTSGGSNSSTKIDLCGNGYFAYYSSSSMSVDVGGAFGNSSSRDGGQGSWEVAGNSSGGTLLRLKFNDGKVWEYQLSTNDKGETFLDGRKYFRIGVGDPNGYGPNCN